MRVVYPKIDNINIKYKPMLISLVRSVRIVLKVRNSFISEISGRKNSKRFYSVASRD